MGKFALSCVAFSFFGFIFLFFAREDIFFRNIIVPAEEILERPLPPYFEVEQSLRSIEGEIIVAVDRKESIRIHLLIPPSPLRDENNIQQLLRLAKVYRVVGGDKPSFPVRYLAAHVDPRRTKLQREIPIIGEDNRENILLLVTAQDEKWFAILYLKDKGMLLIATHPKEQLDPSTVLRSFATLGFHFTITQKAITQKAITQKEG